ncbi:MAG: GNAT family N-acetyltransferase [Thaumarchaeota archaeon]|nr:GNAT family N-acetyltransferase [Nitrososphaerota archaeon]MBI3641309.1 GNAT family N-acetyltransferase [Nitrososphaerota archaeon]
MIISEWVDSEDEKTGIINLSRKVFGNVDIVNPRFFDWQYKQNPCGKAVIVLAKDEEKNNSIIGVESIIPMRLIIDQKITNASLSCNSVVSSDYQKRGIFSQLISAIHDTAIKKGISCIYGVANDKSFNSFIKKDSIEIINLPLLARPLKLSKYFDQPLRALLQPFDGIWKIKKKINPNVVQFTSQFNAEFDILTEKASKRVSIIQKRDKEFLQWRYGNHPTRKYRIFVLKEGSILRGYVITSHAVINGKLIGIIVDFLVDTEVENKEHLKDLLYVALQDLYKNKVSLAIATCRSGLLETKILYETGFFSIPQFLKPQPLHFILIHFDSKNTDLNKLKVNENWYFTFGDYDVF